GGESAEGIDSRFEISVDGLVNSCVNLFLCGAFDHSLDVLLFKGGIDSLLSFEFRGVLGGLSNRGDFVCRGVLGCSDSCGGLGLYVADALPEEVGGGGGDDGKGSARDPHQPLEVPAQTVVV